MTEAFHPVIINTTSTRCRDGEEPSTTVVRETSYAIEAQDRLVLCLGSILLERGGYGDAYRETVQLCSYNTDVVADAVVALLCHLRQQAVEPGNSEMYQARCWSLLRRAADALPADLMAPAESATTEVEA